MEKLELKTSLQQVENTYSHVCDVVDMDAFLQTDNNALKCYLNRNSRGWRNLSVETNGKYGTRVPMTADLIILLIMVDAELPRLFDRDQSDQGACKQALNYVNSARLMAFVDFFEVFERAQGIKCISIFVPHGQTSKERQYNTSKSWPTCSPDWKKHLRDPSLELTLRCRLNTYIQRYFSTNITLSLGHHLVEIAWNGVRSSCCNIIKVIKSSRGG